VKITSKGQVTIPQDVRERHGLLPGTEVRFIDDGHNVRLVKAKGTRGRRGEAIVRRMRGRATTRLITNEILALTRDVECMPTVS
jgi:AbrB family looped-hinge helix DNA binding protein